ncbi:MAG: YgiQ family radical SAM protein [Bacteroidaceae bacterium]|nr:YgiQ family radical SAM protein [Bacteroidaceae bacterium]
MNGHRKTSDWLPTTRKEMELRGWERADVILFSADAYVDHPSFGAAVIGRILEAEGLRVCIVPQPDWHGDYRDFRKLGRPRLWFGVAPGCMDSMVNKYTAARRLRSEDAYSPDGRHDLRPEYPTIVYTRILKELFPDVPVILGGIEASMRRLMHYDYWKERFMPSILTLSGADLVTYGMGEQATVEICRRMLQSIEQYDDTLFYDTDGEACCTSKTLQRIMLHSPVPQTVAIHERETIPGGIGDDDIVLHSYDECLANLRLHAENFRHIEEESNSLHAHRLLQETQGRWVVVYPPFPPMTTQELDHSFDLPYTRLPHPKYDGKRIPAYEMIRHSVCLHRGCFGGCAFCTISAHQGKFVVSRSKESILREVKQVTQMPDFKGYISDLGGPSANMYRMGGKNLKACEVCLRPSCVHPAVCPNLRVDHRPLTDIYRAVDALPGVKKSFIGSGVRYDLILHPQKDPALERASMEYAEELILRHVSGRLKVAPEHTSDRVLEIMRKPSFSLFGRFRKLFDSLCSRHHLPQQIVPYFISSHPGCYETDMAELAIQTKQMNFRLEQVQDFTPTPMTLATTCWATGFHPYTGERIYSAKSPIEKQRQRMYFFWYKPEERRKIESRLKEIGCSHLIKSIVKTP